MVAAEEIRVRLADYVLGEISLEDFEDWFVANSWNAHQSGDPDLQRLVFEIEAKLSEYSGDQIDEQVLRRGLALLAKQITVNLAIGISQPIVTIHTGSTYSTADLAERQIGFVAGIQPSMARV